MAASGGTWSKGRFRRGKSTARTPARAKGYTILKTIGPKDASALKPSADPRFNELRHDSALEAATRLSMSTRRSTYVYKPGRIFNVTRTRPKVASGEKYYRVVVRGGKLYGQVLQAN